MAYIPASCDCNCKGCSQNICGWCAFFDRETHAMWECISALGIKPFKDGNQWCFLYGENIQEGVCGFGETIYKAAWDFYTNVKIEEAEKEE